MKGHIINIFCFLILGVSSSAGQQAKILKATFASKDIFRSAAFLENRNILPDDEDQKVLYYSNHDGIDVAFTQAGMLYRVSSVQKSEEKEHEESTTEEEDENVAVRTCLVRMEWIGANPHPLVTAGEQVQGYYTYLQKNGKGYNTIITYGHKSIRYNDLYPGIDVEYNFPEKGGMEYTLFVKPGADVGKVQMQYSGATETVANDNAGNVVIHTAAGDIVEHIPVSFSEDNSGVRSAFSITAKTVQFVFPDGYDTKKALTIDPWVTVLNTMPPVNEGMDADYDLAGDLFAFGAAAMSIQDITHFFNITKYGPNGDALWTFNGTVPSIQWSTIDTDGSCNYAGNEIVDKSTGKVYMCKGFDGTDGTSVIRLDANGNYDNFVSVAKDNFTEAWGMLYNCSNGDILALGGGVTSDINMGVVNSSGVVASSNITGILSNAFQDIICAAYDANSNLYVIMNSSSAPLPYLNTLYKVNSTFTGNIWDANSTFAPFHESNNAPYWATYGSNWYNGLAANSSYLYYYDGDRIAAFNFNSGSMQGTPYTLNGEDDTLYQGGIAVDNCNNLYLGGVGVIYTFTFNGTVFTPVSTISLGAGFENDTVHDIKYSPTNNLLYVTGGALAGTFNATLSTNCNTSSSMVLTMNSTCTTAGVSVSLTEPVTNPLYTYFWYDASQNLVSQTYNSPSATNTITGLNGGEYYVRVALNLNCTSNLQTDSVFVGAAVKLNTTDTAICTGQSVTITATPVNTGGTLVWTPGGSNSNSITVSPTTTTSYILSYSYEGCTTLDTIPVNVSAAPTLTMTDDSICGGYSTTVMATPSIGGGVFQWSPGGSTADSLVVSPGVNTTYTVTYSVPGCAVVTGTATVTIVAKPDVDVTGSSICEGSSCQVTATPFTSGGTYLWSPGGATTAAITVDPTATTTYTVTYDLSGCTATGSGVVTVNPFPDGGPDQTIGLNATATMEATGSGTWSALAGNPATIVFADANNPQTTVTGFSALGTYYLIWTVNGCSDTIQMDVVTPPGPGPDQFTCFNGFVTMAAGGTSGTWSAVAGNPGVANIYDPSEPNTEISGFTEPGTYAFQWLPTGFPAVVAHVTVYPSPTVSVSIKSTSCSLTTGTIYANAGSGTPPTVICGVITVPQTA